MDPSAAPWRVLEASAAPEGAVEPPGDDAKGPSAPEPRAFLVSPITAGAILGAAVLAIAAFFLASASTGAGAVNVEGGGDLGAVQSGAGSRAPDDPVTVGGAGPNLIVVEIAGAVRRPGVFHLPAGSRVGDLIEAAGGYGPRIDAGRASHELNLAAKLADGDHVAVPSRDEAASSTSSTAGGASPEGDGASGAGPLDLNRATQAELEALPGIGPVTAAKIVTSRDEQAFTAVDDLRARKLVGAKTFDKLKDLVSVR